MLAFAGCGDDGTGGKVSISSDNQPKGDSELVHGDRASGTQNQRVPVTRSGDPVAIYALPARELTDGMRLRAIANVTLTKCAITDYIPHNRQHTACQGTDVYKYDPVDIETSFVLANGDKEPDLDGRTKELGDSLHYRCTTAIHHCTVSQLEETVLDPDDLDDGAQWKWVVFEARATSPHAVTCRSGRPASCNVLAVETQKGTAMYWIQSDPNVETVTPPEPDRTAAVKTLDVLPNKTNKNKVRRVLYSVELAPGQPTSSLEGMQFEVLAKGRIRERLPDAPDIASYIVLSDSPTGIKGRFLISDTYDPDKTGNAGGNCDTECEEEAAAAITTVLPCDVEAGRRYVNVVSAASRMAAHRGEVVHVLPGGFLQIPFAYPKSAGDDPAGDRADCSPTG